ncbi:phosphosugar isomerase [Aureimonas leprariae]|uniref:Phosphosugar isomerase n=1 Tax=Plantimonas leprariae TaxID=2615207 RepID=A0A7V7PTH1_9HYPH|nr:phosphosugar isomerase [Aureimonas leprariae]KAB0682938.1 phosphosugar isomerase [Aureimonas leprariae]
MTTATFDCATWNEIAAQPAIWRAFAGPLAERSAEIRRWIEAAGIGQVWFCGAGTSAFIGETIAAVASPDGPELCAVATTDLVAAPRDHLAAAGSAPLLVVQFGRSGDSSETIGTLDLLDRHLPDAHQLAVTCNAAGALATRRPAGSGRGEVLLLPEATHDRGFAMTSSYTTMLLAALACFDRSGVDPSERLPRLADAAEDAIRRLAASAPPRPGRAIFLGSGALKGVARESALKVLELTAGRTATFWDGTLGFRHGPKASVDASSLVTVLVHPDPHTGRYDLDVAVEIRRQFPRTEVVTVGPKGCDVELALTGDARWDAVLYVLLAQIRAVQWSAALGLDVDDPFAGEGNLSRVVSGVTLYPFAA